MRFDNIDFNKNFLILEVEDGRQLCVPYSKIDYLTQHPVDKKLTIEFKKIGTFLRIYKEYSDLERDVDKLMSKGK